MYDSKYSASTSIGRKNCLSTSCSDPSYSSSKTFHIRYHHQVCSHHKVRNNCSNFFRRNYKLLLAFYLLARAFSGPPLPLSTLDFDSSCGLLLCLMVKSFDRLFGDLFSVAKPRSISGLGKLCYLISLRSYTLFNLLVKIWSS